MGLKIYSRQLNKLYANVEEHYKQHGKYPLFTSVEVETINRCNNICPFCPVNKNDDIRTKKRMSETLFHSIVNNLEDLKFSLLNEIVPLGDTTVHSKAFVNKEKEVAVIGKKGDGLITTKDIEQIVKTDTKFSAIREHLNDDNEATTLLQNIVMTLINIVTLNNSEKITKITEHGFMVKSDNVKGERFVHSTLNSSATQVELEEKTINGANVKVYKSTEGEEYVTTQDNRKYNEEYAAKYLGYKIEKTWFGFGEDKYYTTETQSNGKQYCQYKIWDEDTHSFKNGKRIFIGHFRSTGTL